MTDEPDNRLARLRGSLAPEELGARGLERVARNPGCQRLRALTRVGITPATAVSDVYGDVAREGQSPFALAAGNGFERQLFERDAARLLELYREAGRLEANEIRIVNVSDRVPGRGQEMMARQKALTDTLFQSKLRRSADAPHLIVKPRVPIRLLGVDHGTEPDALVAADGDPFYRPVEIKSYPDRGGKTDPADVRGACRQAAVAVIGLRQAVDRLRGDEPVALVPAYGDLILRRPGSFPPTLRPMTLRGEVDSIERALEEAPRNLDELEALLHGIGPDAAIDDPAVLDAIPNRYNEGCREYCALAQRCKQQALACGDPVLLGSGAREALTAAGSLGRALDLVHSRGASPETPQETMLAAHLSETAALYREALSHGA